VPDLGERRVQFIHVEDLADCAIRCLETAEAVGEAFNVAGEPMTQLETVKALASAAGVVNPEIYGVPRAEIEKAGGQAMGPNYYFAQYLDVPPIAQDTSKAARMLGFKARPLSAGLADTYRWWRASRPEFPNSYATEDGLLSCDSRVRLTV
jgi:nucleoside-diphosphate-sugar epimerase